MTHLNPPRCSFIAVAIACVLSAASVVSAQAVAGQPVASDARTNYVLGPDDQVVIRAVDVPDISEKPLHVDPNGDLRLPVVGRVHAAGLTLEELEAELTKRLRTYLQDPDVTVSVTEFRSQSVSVLGAVAQPGVRQLQGDKTLIEVLSLAGGPTAEAGATVRVTRRKDQGRIPLPEAVDNETTGFSSVDIPLKPLMDVSAPENNIVLHPNDIVSIPRGDVVYVIGEVNKVGAVPVANGKSVSVVEALSASGGALKTAAAGGSRILRTAPGAQKRTEIPVNIAKIMQGRSDDVAMFPGDILVVPDSKGKRATTRALEMAAQFGLMVGTYGIIR